MRALGSTRHLREHVRAQLGSSANLTAGDGQIKGSDDPDWLLYERRVLRAFQTTGYGCQHNVRVPGVRGTHQVDVFVQVPAVGGHQEWIVECKRRTRAVTKADLMTLRSIVDDVGGSHGFLVTESGAQRGAYDYAHTTNLTIASYAEIEASLRAEQLETANSRADDLELALTFEEEDHGNFDSECVVSVRSVTGRAVADRIVEVVVERRAPRSQTWSFSPEAYPELTAKSAVLNISIPWDPIRWLGLHLENEILLDGESIDGPYRVGVRTTSGPMSLVVFVPPFK